MGTMDPETGTDLLRQAREGSSDALGALLERCSPKLLALVRLRLGPTLRARLESRDILQAALTRAIEGFPAFEGRDPGSLMAWLARIAANEIRDQADFHGAQRRDAACAVALEAAPETARLAARVRSQTSRIALDERLAHLERALEALPADQREVIILRRMEELSFPEIAAQMGRSADACRMLFGRAMAALTLAMPEAL